MPRTPCRLIQDWCTLLEDVLLKKRPLAHQQKVDHGTLGMCRHQLQGL